MSKADEIKELEEAIKILKHYLEIEEFDSAGDFLIAIDKVLNYIDNSVSKEEYNKIKEENEKYKKQSWENEITNLIYKNLRKCFNNMVDRILGEKYYNMGMDTYTCDKLTCEDIINKKVKIIFKDNNSISKEEYNKIKEELDEYKRQLDLDYVRDNFIYKEVIEEKIKELDKEEKEAQDSINDEEREEYSDSSIGYLLANIETRRQVLQELLEGK